MLNTGQKLRSMFWGGSLAESIGIRHRRLSFFGFSLRIHWRASPRSAWYQRHDSRWGVCDLEERVKVEA